MLIVRIIDNAKKINNILSTANANSTLSGIQMITLKKVVGELIQEYKTFLDLRNISTDLCYVALGNLWELLSAGKSITGTKTSMIAGLVGSVEIDIFTELFNFYYSNDMNIGDNPPEHIRKFIDYMLIKLARNGHKIKEGIA